jgi:hypothetical protein
MNRFLLRGALVAILALVLALPATAVLPQTVEVPGNNAPAVNGANLLAAYAGVPATAGPTEPWVVKVDAGIYDLGGAQLVLRNFVDLEGSGRNATFVNSTFAGTGAAGGVINVPAGVDAEIRSLTIQSFSAASGIAVVNNSTELKLSTVNLEVDVAATGIGYLNVAGDARLGAVFARVSAGNIARGFQTDSGGPIINEAFAFVASFGNDNIGFFATGDSDPLIQDLAIVVLGGQNTNYGVVSNNSALPRFTNTRVTASGGGGARAFSVGRFSRPVLKEVIADATNSAGEAIGLRTSNAATVVATESSFSGDGAPGIGVVNGGNRIDIRASTVVGNTSAVSNLAATVQTFFGASQLDGGLGGVAGVLQCAQSYDGAYVDIGPACI